MTQLLLTTIINERFLNLDVSQYTSSVSAIHHRLEQSENEPTGWLNGPIAMDSQNLYPILTMADEIKKNAEVLIVIGVGGSYLGAKAVQEALTPYFQKNEDGIEVIYVGYNLSGSYMKQIIDSLQGKEFYVNVISKSGSTMESSLAFRVLRKYTVERYGEEGKERIIVTTDPEKGLLKEIADTRGYRRLEIPSNIGGRYSILTAVGLLPIAVVGVNIVELMEGAKKAALDLKEESLEKNEAYRYAMIRHALYTQGFRIELLASFEPALSYIHEWWKQLFGESEGKSRKGLFPAAVSYSADLHSLGQFVQEGSPILFETFLHFKEVSKDYSIPYTIANDDGLNYLSNRTFNEINSISKQGTVLAHAEGGVPIIQIEVEKLDAFHVGYLIYFFMKACAMSAYLLEVYPFDQPGVEAYKKKITELLIEESVAH
ncbi:glucose-6-phosphate isomerase [Ureibacillus chungkukjangi]|uniref:glucose-6-phosphate isomerase n=1 Tax=Ureibacillus chungkukjangi TaxID=1202712 RepID=UPI00384EEF5E